MSGIACQRAVKIYRRGAAGFANALSRLAACFFHLSCAAPPDPERAHTALKRTGGRFGGFNKLIFLQI